MLQIRAHLFSALPADPVPDWVHLVPAGTFGGVDGRGPYHLTDAQAVIAASLAGGKLPIDENHAIDLAAPKGGSTPARGWIVELQARADGIWGKVEWTTSGQSLMADKAYRGLSPALMIEQGTGRVASIARASLVNTPNLPQLKTLHSRSTDDMDFIVQARAALGLPAEADEAAVIAAITAQKTELSTHSAVTAAIAKSAGLGADVQPEAVAAKVELHFQGAQTEEAKLRQTVITLQSQMDTLAAAGKQQAAERAVDEAIIAGKPIKALREHYISRHMADPQGVAKEIGALPSIHSGGITRPPADADPATGLTAEQLTVCTLMSLDPAKYAETLKGQKMEAL